MARAARAAASFSGKAAPVADVTSSPYLAPLLALGASLCFGIGWHLIRQGLYHLDSQRGSAISIATTTLCLALLAPLWFQVQDWRNPGLLAFVVAGLVHPVLSRYLGYEANRRVGPTVSMTFDSTSPLFAAALAIGLLGESPSPGIALGTLLTVGGVTVIYWTPIAPAAAMRVAVLFALGAALFRAVGMVAGKVGLNVLPNPLMAAFVTFAVSALIALGTARWQGKALLRPLLAGAKPWWFVGSGILSAIASVCLYDALLIGDAVVVIPIVCATPLFTMMAGALLGLETLTRRIVLGVVIAVAGVILVSTS